MIFFDASNTYIMTHRIYLHVFDTEEWIFHTIMAISMCARARCVTSFLYNPIIIYFLPVLFALCALEWAKFTERTIQNSRAHNERILILSFIHCVEFLTLSFNNTIDEKQFNADSSELLPVQSIEMGYFCESSFVS